MYGMVVLLSSTSICEGSIKEALVVSYGIRTLHKDADFHKGIAKNRLHKHNFIHTSILRVSYAFTLT